MDCIQTICLYLKKYISDEQFGNIFMEYLDDFQRSLDEDIYLDILLTNFSCKEQRISLKTTLHNYVLKNFRPLYEKINDVYVDCIIDSNKEDVVVEILKSKYEKRKLVEIDCSMFDAKSELISSIKNEFYYPEFCGNNWAAIEDLIHDIILPEKVIFHNWCVIEKKLPQDTAILKGILDKNCKNCCVILYD